MIHMIKWIWLRVQDRGDCRWWVTFRSCPATMPRSLTKRSRNWVRFTVPLWVSTWGRLRLASPSPATTPSKRPSATRSSTDESLRRPFSSEVSANHTVLTLISIFSLASIIFPNLHFYFYPSSSFIFTFHLLIYQTKIEHQMPLISLNTSRISINYINQHTIIIVWSMNFYGLKYFPRPTHLTHEWMYQLRCDLHGGRHVAGAASLHSALPTRPGFRQNIVRGCHYGRR